MKHSIALILCCLTLPQLDASGQSDPAPAPAPVSLYDVVVYGDSSGAVVAAIAAKREGRSVIWVNPTGFAGGMSSSGLGATDFLGYRNTFGGIASEFYDGIAKAYGTDFVRSFEPHVGKQVFEQMIAAAGVTVVHNEQLDRTSGKGVTMDGKRIKAITTLSGKSYHGKMFIDATYVGDLMAAAGVTYTVGREPESQYGEDLAGVRRGDTKPRVHYGQRDKDHFVKEVDAYVKPGDPSSGLLPHIHRVDGIKNGQGDKKIQAYNYRVCLTTNPANRIPLEKPPGYREIDHELLLRNFDAGDTRLPALIEPLAGGQKVDWNNMHAVGSDFPGGNWEYPEASHERRREIEKAHETYIRGFLWTMANHPRVPEEIRRKTAAYGLPKDEFTDNGGWPWMIYIREARRMVGDYVMTQLDCEGKRRAPDPVALGSFGMDSHVVQHFVTENGKAQNDGVIWRVPPRPYGISYRSIIPPKGQCENLFSPICLSATHVAHGSIRMEPVFMSLSQSAAIAAGLAIDNGVSVQDVPYAALRDKLEAAKQIVRPEAWKRSPATKKLLPKKAAATRPGNATSKPNVLLILADNRNQLRRVVQLWEEPAQPTENKEPGQEAAARTTLQAVFDALGKHTLITLAALLLEPLAALSAAEAPPASPARDSGAAANLLQNPSFEARVGDGVEGWTSRAWAGKEATRWSVETPGRTGERCVSIASDRGGDAAWTAMVSVQPGAWYRLSGWIKTKDVRGAAGALLHIQNMQRVWTRAVSGTRDWTRVATVFQADAATNLEINCLFGGWGSSTGQAWYDDVVLQHIAEPPDETRAAVTIDTDAPSVLYSPMIFGGFLEHFNNQIYGGVFEPGSPLADEKGFRRDVLAALKELKVPIVRWPGGCYVSGYRWEAGVGKERKPTDDMAWGVVEPNTFGTDEYVELCRTLGWTPYICNNAGNGTVEEMRNWVEYCNAREGKYAQMRKDSEYAEPRNVPIWSIGNENYWEQEIGYKPIQQWAPLVLEGAKAMKKADSRIQLTAAALPTREWTLPLLKAAGDYLDYISLHGYWIYHGNKGSVHNRPDYLTCIMYSESPEERINDFIGVLEESGYRGRIKIAFDEWNLRAWYHPGFPRKTVQDYHDPEVKRLVAARENNDIASQYTMADALFSASFFNACLRHAEDVGMANIAPIVNTRGPLYVHPQGIVKRTHFHAMAMYANELEPRVGKLELEAGILRHGNRSIPVLDGVATVDESGKQWAVALVNRHPAKPVACTVKMKDRLLDGEYAALVLTGDSPEAFNDSENPNRVTPQKTTLTFIKGAVNLPPHSLTIAKVPLK